ncbi:MAG: hypothetical protein L0191_21155 [Acidobacteria bacterium]|nr:hypothetical protein [Acidobacteriota bacterium]
MTLPFLAKAAILGVILYAGSVLGFPYYQYLMMKYAVEEAADIAVAHVQAARRGPWREEVVIREVTAMVTELMRDWATWLALDVPADGVQIQLEPDLVRTWTTWETEARLPVYSHRFRFRVEGRRVLTR